MRSSTVSASATPRSCALSSPIARPREISSRSADVRCRFRGTCGGLRTPPASARNRRTCCSGIPSDRDIELYVELAHRADGPLVELAIGNGRVAIPVARDTGQPVIGVDTSPRMLEQARTRAAIAGVRLELRQADMREL
ncbi:class I SAM-dependent methyltransferase [Nocardia testacea]|uniref:class I SAM-dependent methyltransferase n=1 Tax=Nocardia testacea TaxID=248551 RepID=UPI003F4D1B82